ncbi:uncharacterized protein LOC120430716 [Culex pipiens pallens]|uniref:uncharacterized protein LOC120430716 n=1 Tax=Culex pipiens pallens TaxID=42434 RepID=UPI00195473D6|nr:uncharacterized protein LOC120430716 [Culex pipiens pallens]
MSPAKRLASFCRLCLIKAETRVAIFGQQEEANLLNLLKLIDLDIDHEVEPEAVLCYDCIVTLEGFHQFKEQCHTNDEFLRTLPPRDSDEGSEEVSEVDEQEEPDYLQEDDVARIVDSEEEGRVEDDDLYEQPVPKKRGLKETPTSAKRLKTSEEPLDVRQSGRIRKPTAKALASPIRKTVPPRITQTKAAPLEAKPKRRKPEPIKIREPTADELHPLKDSYPDYFHFEKSPRSLYFTLVYYGERFNSAIYGASQTYWQCAYKRKFRCTAVVHVSNDYTHFERRFEHTHGEQREKESELELFTPRQALPAVFRICWQKLMEKKARQQITVRVKKEKPAKKKPEVEKVETEEEEEQVEEDYVSEYEEVEVEEDDGADSLLKMLETDPEDED